MFKTLNDYSTFAEALADEDEKTQWVWLRNLARCDLFFLGWFICARHDLYHPWLLERTKEIQKAPNGYIDLWARAHYKSTLITYLKTIQDILVGHGDDPQPVYGHIEPTIGIFSFSRPIAKQFLSQIKREFEQNTLLRQLFPDIIWKNPRRESARWSEDSGLIVKRKSNPKEATLEAWGLVDSQPTSKHFTIMIYDDVVTIDTVRSEWVLKKTMEAWELSTNLSVDDGVRRIIGTRYHFNDPYSQMIERELAILRIYPATKDATPDGEPVLYSRQYLKEKYREMGHYVFAAQMLLNPVQDSKQSLSQDWLQYYTRIDMHRLNRYILVDPANSKRKDSDYTAMAVIGLGEDNNFYILALLRGRLNLVERTQLLFALHKQYRPLKVGYEQYGMQADIQHIEHEQKLINYRFHVEPLGGKISKRDRIVQLGAIFQDLRIFLPQTYYYEGEEMINIFLGQEYLMFPYGQHDDMLDVLARILDPDLNIVWPSSIHSDKIQQYYRHRRQRKGSPWAV